MNYNIPLFELNFNAQEEKAVLATLRSKWITMGPRVAEFEKAFSKHLGVKHVIALSNCTTALHLAVKILGIKSGDEVIVPSLTFVATVNAVKYENANPIFADIVGYSDLTIDPVDLENKITKNTKAIIVMHYGGFPCRMDKIMAIARKHRLSVIEDAAHAPDSKIGGKHLGTIGSVGCFSFFSNKNISCAEGGAIVTNDDTIASRARLLRAHGMTTMSYERAKGHATEYDVVDVGYNYRLDDIRASILCVQLQKLPSENRRNKIRKAYVVGLKKISNIIVPFLQSKGKSSNYIMPVILKVGKRVDRDKVRAYLEKHGIQTSVHYPAVHRFTMYGNGCVSLPRTEYVADHLITLPFHSKMTIKQVDIILDLLSKALCELQF